MKINLTVNVLFLPLKNFLDFRSLKLEKACPVWSSGLRAPVRMARGRKGLSCRPLPPWAQLRGNHLPPSFLQLMRPFPQVTLSSHSHWFASPLFFFISKHSQSWLNMIVCTQTVLGLMRYLCINTPIQLWVEKLKINGSLEEQTQTQKFLARMVFVQRFQS